MLDKILEFINEEELLRADGFDSAIIGLDDRSMRLIYSKSLCINILISQGMTEEEALEYFEFNVSSAWLGDIYLRDMAPIWCLDDL
jgi:hypothetical protein